MSDENKNEVESELQINKDMLLGQGLMIVAGSDKEITPPEMDWLKNTWLCQYENSDTLFDLLVRFNYREESKTDFFNTLNMHLTIEEKKKFIYDSIQMASSDMVYSTEEKECVKMISDIFGLNEDTLSAIESLKEMEDAVEITKNAILKD